MKVRGTVVEIRKDQGFSFIRDKNGKLHFALASAFCSNATLATLKATYKDWSQIWTALGISEGNEVEFTPEKNPRALSVRKI